MSKKSTSIITSGIILCIILGLVITGSIPTLLSQLPLIRGVSAQRSSDIPSVEQLQSQVTSLQAEVASLLYLKSENELLKSAIETKNDTAIMPIQARIIAFDNNFVRSSATLNVGSSSGIRENQPVIYLGHMIGIIRSVNENFSQVQFINDTSSKIAVTVQKDNPSQGVLGSQYGTLLQVDLISKLEPVAVEQKVVTTQTDTMPGGLLIGTIKEVSEGDLFHRIIVETPINFYQLTDVFILKT